MDNLAHSLVGLTAAKAGLERLSPAATTVCVLAANSPDVDVVLLLTSDRWTFLHHHRGITHSIVGTLALGVLLPTVFWLGDRGLGRLRKRTPVVRYRGLLLASVIAAATHPLMDWTNNYGVRPFLPWSSQWLYGDLVYIIDPFLWLVVGSAAFLRTSDRRLGLFLWLVLGIALTTLVMFVARQQNGLAHPNFVQVVWLSVVLLVAITRALRVHVRPGRAIAWGALIVVALYWSALGLAHRKAYAQTINLAEKISSQRDEQFVRAATMPTLADPLDWRCVVETDRAFYRFLISLSDGHIVPSNDSSAGATLAIPGIAPRIQRYQKPTNGEEQLVAVAGRDSRAQVLLGFARFPLGRAKDPNCTGQTLVEFADLRYTEPGSQRGNFSLDVPVDCPQK